jgi:membrane-bound lytic murein transglycosylase C
MNNKSVILLLSIGLLFSQQQTFEEYKKQQEQAFSQYKASVTKEYEQYEQAEKAAYAQFKEDVEKQWETFKGSTKKTYVSYDEDLQSRASINYEVGEVTIEIILEEDEIKDSYNNDRKMDGNSDTFGFLQTAMPRNNLMLVLRPLLDLSEITSPNDIPKGETISFESVRDKIANAKLTKKLVGIISEKDDNGKSILHNQLINAKGAVVETGKVALDFAKKITKTQAKKIKNYIGKDGKKRISFSLTLPLRPDHKEKRLGNYKNEIIKQAKRFKIDPTIALAVTETESAFNPKATSHIPAYGLMELVPASGARDAYLYVYGKDKFLGKRYLYKPDNNIELGCAYLAQIRYKYFKNIKDDEKAYMCTIPAYNTGIGNVAKALVNQSKLQLAAEKANSMSPDQLYKKLHKDLKAKEARDYLERVWSRKDKY